VKIPSNTKRQIKILYILTFLGEFYLIIPVWFFFYSKYLSFEQIATLLIAQQIAQLLLEVPSGALADLIGKKVTLVLSYILFTISILLIPFVSTFIFFLILEILKGIAKSLYSGTFEALSYDTLVDDDKESQYPKILGNITTISWVGYILAGLAGGLLYDLWYPLPFLILGLFYFVNFLITLFFIKEPHTDTETFSFKKYLKQNVQGFRELFPNFNKSLLVITLLIITLGYFTTAELLGISQGESYGLTPTQVGLLFSIGYLISASLSKLFPILQNKFNNKVLIVSSSIILIISFLLAKFVSPVLGGVLIIARISSSTTFSNTRSLELNSMISSKNRATALSSFSLLYTLIYLVIAYSAGQYMKSNTPNEFLFIVGITMIGIFAILGLIKIILSLHSSNHL
jgi:MFS family permease